MAVKTAPAPARKTIERLGDWLSGSKPRTVAEVQQQLAKVDADASQKHDRLDQIAALMVDDYGADTSALEAEHSSLLLKLSTAGKVRQRLEAELSAALDRQVEAAHVELCDDLSSAAEALNLLESGELAEAYRLFRQLEQQSAELRYTVNIRQQLIGDHRSANPRAAEALKAVESGVADILDSTFLAHWRGPKE